MMYTENKYSFLENDNCLRFDPARFQKAYSVEMFIEEDTNNKTRITHDAFVRTIEVIRHDVYLVSVVLWNFLINNEKPDLVLEQLAEKCRRPLENLEFYVNSKWQITGLHNYNDIAMKWQDQKRQLEQEYSGELFEKYITKHDFVMKHPEILLEKLKKDVFITQFFSPIYNVAFHDYSFRHKENIRLLNIDYEIDMLFSLQERDKDDNIMLVKHPDKKGDNFRQMPVDYYKAEYLLGEDFSIKSINGKFENHGRKFIYNITENSSIA